MNEFDDSTPLDGPVTDLGQGERTVWRGKPSWRSLALHLTPIRTVAAYFVILMVWRVVAGVYDGIPAADLAVSTAWLLVPAVLSIGILLAFAALTARTSSYTITTKRILFRCGIAFPMRVTVPLSIIESAGLTTYRDGTGDLSVKVEPGHRISYLLFWPHARPWRIGAVEPTLRGLADAESAAGALASALEKVQTETPIERSTAAEQADGAPEQTRVRRGRSAEAPSDAVAALG